MRFFPVVCCSILLTAAMAAGGVADPTTARLSAPTTGPTTSPSVISPLTVDLQAAAKPLMDFAQWCATNKAKSVGESALQAAKSVVDSPDRLVQIAYALRSASDDDSDAPAVAKNQQAAYESAADLLQKFSALSHAATADATFDSYLIKAVRLSPKGRLPLLKAAVARAIGAHQAQTVIDAYAVLLLRDNAYAMTLEKGLLESGQLPAAARKGVAEYLAGDQALDALAYLTRLAPVDPKEFAASKYQPCTDLLAARSLLVRTPKHAMVAYVSIPWKWSPVKPTPVIFCFAGAGKDYQSLCDSYHNVIGDGPFIVVAPVTLSNTNVVDDEGFHKWYAKEVIKIYASETLNARTIAQRLEFDQPGVLALFKSIHDAANTEDRMCITGFLGGGIPCYAMMIESPNVIAAAAPACANYYLNLPAHGTAAGIKVQQFFGEKDPYNAAIGNGRGLIAQGREAAGSLKAMGYEVAEPSLVPNASHVPMASQVVDFFKSARVGKSR